MDYDGGFILQKDVNWSLLTEGLAIPTSVCSRFADWDATNIIIISPNYHRIIHKNNPRFNRKKFQYEFANCEVLKLYEHLKVG